MAKAKDKIPQGSEDLLKQLIGSIDKLFESQKKQFKSLSDAIIDNTKGFDVLGDEFGAFDDKAKELMIIAQKELRKAGEVLDKQKDVAVKVLGEQFKIADKLPTKASFEKALLKAMKEEMGPGGEAVAKTQTANVMKTWDLIVKRYHQTKKEVDRFTGDIMQPFDALYNKLSKSKFGDMFLRWTGIDKIKAQTQQKISGMISEALEDGGMSMKKFGAIAKTEFAGIGNAVKAAFAHPILLAIAAIVALLYIAYKQWSKFMDASKTIRDETGLVATQSMEIAMISRDIAKQYTAMGVSMEVMGKTAGALINEFQIWDKSMKGMLLNAGLMVGVLGVSEQAAAKVVKQFKAMGGLTDEMSGNLIATIAHASKLGKVAPSKVLEDMAESAKEINLYFHGNIIAAAKAAIELRRMGSSLKDAANTAKGLLDFESSITAELEASVLIGRQIDLSKARYLAFEGEIQLAQEETLRQIGSISEFEAMRPFQKEAIAKAANMEVDQIATMLYQKKLISKMDTQQKKDYKEAIGSLGKMNDLTKEQLLSDAQRHFAQEKLAMAWDNLLFTLSSVLFPIFDGIYAMVEPIANAIQELFSNMKSGEPLLKGVKESFKEIGEAVATLLPPFIEFIKVIMPVLIRHLKMYIGFWVTGLKIVTALFKGDFTEIAELIPKLFASAAKLVLNGLLLIPQMFLAVFDSIFGTNLRGIITSFIDWFGTAWEDTTAFINYPILQIIAGFDKLKTFLTKWWDFMYVTMFKPWVDIISWIGGAIGSVGDFLFGSGDETSSNVPTTAKGGVVTRPQIRMVGEKGPEAIIPLNQTGAWDNSGIISKLDELIVKSDPLVVTRKLDEMISAITSMKLYMDSREVGGVLAETTPHPGLV